VGVPLLDRDPENRIHRIKERAPHDAPISAVW
jgi:hypothetical protein